MVSVGVVLDYISCEVLLSFRIASLHPSSLLATVKRPIFSLVTQPVLLKGKTTPVWPKYQWYVILRLFGFLMG